MGRMPVRSMVMEFLAQHVDQVVHVDQVMEDLGLDKVQVQQGMNHLLNKGVVEAVVRGNAWIYRARITNGPVEVVEVPAGDLGGFMEIVKPLNDGRILLQDTHGALFIATKVEL